MAEDIKFNDNIASDAEVARAKFALGTGIGLVAGIPIAMGIATGDWNPFDWYDFSEINTEPEVDTPKTEDVEKEAVKTADAEEVTGTNTDEVVAKDATAPDCACDEEKPTPVPVATTPCEEVAEEVVEKVCLGPEEALTATADSSCDGIISLTREALWGNADFVTPEMVANIENPAVKAVYQALLDGDRSALTTALTNLYTENGAYIPENAGGVLDGKVDSIIIHDGDKIVINENGWFLDRKGVEEPIQIVNCDGDLKSLSDETKIDTGTCGDAIIPTNELPKEDIEPLCSPCEADNTEPVAKKLTDAEIKEALYGVTPEDIDAYNNGVISQELKELLKENKGAVLANLYSDSSGASMPFIVTEGPVTSDDFTYAARSGYYETTTDAYGKPVYKFNVQQVGADGLSRPYCVEVSKEGLEVLKRGNLDNITLKNGSLTFKTPEQMVVTDSKPSGTKVTLPITGETATVVSTREWQDAIQKDAHFGAFKTRG